MKAAAVARIAAVVRIAPAAAAIASNTRLGIFDLRTDTLCRVAQTYAGVRTGSDTDGPKVTRNGLCRVSVILVLRKWLDERPSGGEHRIFVRNRNSPQQEARASGLRST